MMFSRVAVVIFLMCAAQASLAQAKNRYMVFFKDKASSPYSISNPSVYLSESAIERRLVQSISVTENDLPVNPTYVQGVKNTGVQVFYKTRWMNGLLIQCKSDDLAAVSALSFVDHIDLVAPGEKLVPNGRKRTTQRDKSTATAEVTQTQNAMLGIDEMHIAGIRGEGIVIAVLDAGFPGVDVITPFATTIAEGRINEAVSHDFVYNTSNPFQYDSHGTQVLSVITASIPGVFTGGAPKASFQLYVTEDASSEYRVEEYNWLFAAERADSAGADVISSSLGYYDFDDASMNYAKTDLDGNTAVITRAARMASQRGMVVVCSAGNEGNIPSWRTITAPADADGVIAVANVNAQGSRNSSSSTGPSADGRIKPDLAAMGTSVSVIKPNGAVGTATGTSVAAPLMTSLVAGVWQRYPELTSVEVIDVLRKTASQANNPDNELGYGIPNFKAVVNYQEQQEQEDMFVVYPNPVDDTVNIRPKDPELIASCNVEIISAQGILVGQHTVEFSWLNRVYQDDLSLLAAGLYFMRIRIADRQFTFKLVKR